jgi:predicted metal-dependent phosphoesterase TrpH
MRFDLHVHSSHSKDAAASPLDIVRRCRSLGLDGCSITDHNSMSGSAEALASIAQDGFVVIRGIEVSTSGGHVLAYGLSEAPPRGRPLVESVEWVRSRGGLAVAAHPERFPSGMGIESVVSSGFKAVEVLNGGSSTRANRAAENLAEAHSLSRVGGSDAHKLEEVGRAYTILEDCYSEDDVIAAISKGLSSVGGRSRSRKEGVLYAFETLADWMRRGMDRV